MEAPRTEYRARLQEISGRNFIVSVEKNMIDPAATKRTFQETLRTDKAYVDLMNEYITKARVFTQKCQRKNADRSKTVRALKGEIDLLKGNIKKRETEIKKTTLVYSFVPAGYMPMEREEALGVTETLGKLKSKERLTAEKEIVKMKPAEQVQ